MIFKIYLAIKIFCVKFDFQNKNVWIFFLFLPVRLRLQITKSAAGILVSDIQVTAADDGLQKRKLIGLVK